MQKGRVQERTIIERLTPCSAIQECNDTDTSLPLSPDELVSTKDVCNLFLSSIPCYYHSLFPLQFLILLLRLCPFWYFSHTFVSVSYFVTSQPFLTDTLPQYKHINLLPQCSNKYRPAVLSVTTHLSLWYWYKRRSAFSCWFPSRVLVRQNAFPGS